MQDVPCPTLGHPLYSLFINPNLKLWHSEEEEDVGPHFANVVAVVENVGIRPIKSPAVASDFKPCKMCISPVILVREKFDGWLDVSTPTATRRVPCHKCMECRRDRQLSWMFRLEQEMKVSQSAIFFTMTYEVEPKSQNGHGTLVKSHFQNFMKRLRKLTSNKLRYFVVGEYGSKFLRPHYHAIIYNLPQNLAKDLVTLETVWRSGHYGPIAVPGICHLGDTLNGSLGYVAGYVMKGAWSPQHDEETGLMDDRLPEYANMSKNLGLNYLTPSMTKFYQSREIGYITLPGGILQKMPRYYMERLYDRPTRANIAYENEQRNSQDWDQFVETCVSLKDINDMKIRQYVKKQKLERQTF